MGLLQLRLWIEEQVMDTYGLRIDCFDLVPWPTSDPISAIAVWQHVVALPHATVFFSLEIRFGYRSKDFEQQRPRLAMTDSPIGRIIIS